MDFNGKWIQVRTFGPEQDVIEIEDNIIKYNSCFVKEPFHVSTSYKLEESPMYTKEDMKCYRIIVDSDERPVPEFYIHVDTYEGQEIRVISDTTFEYDGRGLIVLREYVHEDDFKCIDKEFKSKLYRLLNDRPVPSMTQTSDGMMGGFMGVSMMGKSMEMMNFINANGGMPGITECGNKAKQEE